MPEKEEMRTRRKSLLNSVQIAIIVISVFSLLVTFVPKLDFPGELLRPRTMPRLNLEGTENHFYSELVGDSLSQSTLYHGIGDSIKHAKAADILFVGNSRLQSGLRHHFAERAQAAGLKAFSIGAGHSEGTRFAMDIIRKHRLQPQILVVMGGPYLYWGSLSEVAKQAKGMTWWAAYKKYWEEGIFWFFQRQVHRHIPKLCPLNQPLISQIVNYRSIETGWWKAVYEPNHPFPIKAGKELPSYEFVLPQIDDIMALMAKQDTLVILSCVPYMRTLTGHFTLIKERYDIPLLLPSFEGLATNDGSHLHPDSAAIYSERFWQGLMALPQVQEKLRLGKQ